MEFNYNNEWFKEKLETIIDKDSFTGKGDDWQVEEYLDEHFGSEYGYYDNFQKERVSFSPAKIASLDDYYEDYEPDGRDLSEIEMSKHEADAAADYGEDDEKF